MNRQPTDRGGWAQPRVPFAPVMACIGAANQSEAARLLGIPLRRVHRYVHTGIPIRQADTVAVQAQAHPLELWPEWDALLDWYADWRYMRKIDSNRMRAPVPASGWDAIERSWRQWRAQRERLYYDRLDRASERVDEP